MPGDASPPLSVRPAGPWVTVGRGFENGSAVEGGDSCPGDSLPGVREYLADVQITDRALTIQQCLGTIVGQDYYRIIVPFLLVLLACHKVHGNSLSSCEDAINVAGVTLFAVCGVAVLCIVLLYADTLKHIMRKAPPSVKTNSAFVLSVYPVIAVATYCAMVVPRAHLLAEAVTQGIFTAALYQLFCLCVSYSGGEAQMICSLPEDSLSLQVGPCCCWPCCCCCLPDLPVTKRNIRMLRILVLQLPVIQALVHLVSLVMWAEEESLYHVNYMFFQPLIAISILFGIWGMTMTVKMLTTSVSTHKLNLKFMVLQMVLLLSKLQGLITRIILWSNVLPCKPPISPAVYVNVIYNTMMIAEMAALCFLARILYVGDLGDKEAEDEEGVQKIAARGSSSDGLASREEQLTSSPFALNIVTQIAPGKLWHMT